MFELLFLLLPVAAVYGYFMGKNYSKQKLQESKNQQNANYLRGFDYLLNNEQDKAVDKFIAYFNSKDPSFESSIALGTLFRQRGEVDKAISLHEKMSNDRNLDDSENMLSMLELSHDFISAGLLDRAEAILLKMVEIPTYRSKAAKLLLTVYEKEQDFEKAVNVAAQYFEANDHSVSKLLSQYRCEIAKKLAYDGKKTDAVSELRKAITCYEKSKRARLELADVLISQRKFNDAYKLVKEVSAIDPSLGIVCLEKLKQCFPNIADPNYRYALEDLVHRTNSASAMVELVKTVEQSSCREDAIALLESFLKNKSNLKLFSQMLELKAHSSDVKANESIMQLKSVLDAHISLTTPYFCPNCGFESRMLFWQCPSCRRWESMKAKIGLDGD